MIETEGIVVALDEGIAVVETGPRATGCGRCYEPGGCGGGLLNQKIQDTQGAKRQYRVSNGIEANIGDRVLLCTPEGTIVKAALLSYGIPLALAIIGAALGAWQFHSDAAALAGSVLGLVSGFFLFRFVAKGREPVLILQFKSHSLHDACLERKSTI